MLIEIIKYGGIRKTERFLKLRRGPRRGLHEIVITTSSTPEYKMTRRCILSVVSRAVFSYLRGKNY